MWQKLKKILGVITDVLIYGRGKGWWQRRQDPVKRRTGGVDA